MEKLKILHEGDINVGPKKDQFVPKLGFYWENKKIMAEGKVHMIDKPVFEFWSTWAACSHFNVGKNMKCDRDNKKYNFELALAGHFEKTM